MTEQDWNSNMIIALFNAIGALSVRLLGDSFVVCVKDAEGNVHHVFPDDSRVTWVNGQGEVASPPADSPVFSDMHCSLHGEWNDRTIKSAQDHQEKANPSR